LRKTLLIFCILLSGLLFGQTKEEKPVKPKEEKAAKAPKPPKPKKLPTPDSMYYAKYKSSIILAYYGSTKGYQVEMNQFMNKDSLKKSGLVYVAESNWVDGAEITYDKLSLSFGFKSTPPKNAAQKGKTDFYNFGFNIGGNKWILEASYRRYKGFYERNTVNYDTTFLKTGIYYQQPSLSSLLYKAKFLWFSNNKRFAFKSCYSSLYRQIKSSFTWVITANGYYNTLSSDSSIIPMPIQRSYDHYSSLKGLDVFGFSVYGGASFNLVLWKHLVINATLLAGPEDQFRTYYFDSLPSRQLNYIRFSGDVRGAIGLNYNKFFTFVSFIGDITPYKNSQFELKSTYYSINFTMGARIHTKYPKFYRKFQATKLYRYM
jgi:hypothetical protein